MHTTSELSKPTSTSWKLVYEYPIGSKGGVARIFARSVVLWKMDCEQKKKKNNPHKKLHHFKYRFGRIKHANIYTLYVGDHSQETHTVWKKTEACCCYKGINKDNKHIRKLDVSKRRTNQSSVLYCTASIGSIFIKTHAAMNALSQWCLEACEIIGIDV
jgi:hypothetical protein